MNGYHECGVDGHTQRVKDGTLFCAYHWRSVSRPTQARVYATWDAYKRPDRTLADVQAYRAAVEQANAEAGTKTAA